MTSPVDLVEPRVLERKDSAEGYMWENNIASLLRRAAVSEWYSDNSYAEGFWEHFAHKLKSLFRSE